MARTNMSGESRPPPHHTYMCWDFEITPPMLSETKAMATQSGKGSILDLPDELLLLIISNLVAVRLDQPQSQAFKNRHEETSRQYENYYRRIALHSLCLASRRLNQLAVPALYGAIIGSTTNYGILPLHLVWRTLNERKELRLHIQYIENLLEDCLGNKLVHDLEADGAEELVDEYFEKLAWIIRMCPNIRQLSVISVESPSFTLWRHLFELPRHSLSKLEKLAFQTNISEQYSEEDNVDFNRILFTLLGCSSMTELRASGVSGGLLYQIPTGSTFKSLQRIEITECTLPYQDVNNALSLCDNLRHFVCHWAFLWSFLSHQQVDLLPDLQKQHKTLETLYLVANRAGFDSTSGTWVSCPSLCQMTSLKEAKLCNLFIPDKQCRMPPGSMSIHEIPIAPELPPSLEQLTISYTMHFSDPDTWRASVYKSLQQLAYDCSQYLPRLRELVIQYEGGRLGLHGGDDEELVRWYGVKGVRFSVVEELDVLATLH